MKERYIQVKRTKNAEVDRTQASKLKIVDSTLRKYIDMTVTRFNSKCVMLVNQIEEMKREFTAQIEGMSEFFPASYEKVTLPYVSQSKKSKRLSSDNSTTKIESNSTLEQPNEAQTRKQFFKSPLMKTEKNEDKSFNKKLNVGQALNIDNKISLRLKGASEAQDQPIIPQVNELFKSTNRFNNVEVLKRMKAIQPPKNKAFFLLAHMRHLPFEERIKIKFLNKVLHKEIQIGTLLSSSKESLENQLSEIALRKHKDFPSQTSQSSLNFIRKENENDLKDMRNKHNVMFCKLIYILSNQTIPDQISYEHVYESVLRVNQVQSIKQLFLSVFLKRLVECPFEFSDVVLDQFLSVINEHPILISQKELMNESKSLSLFSFCLKEFHQLFLFEQKKREEMSVVRDKIKEIEHLIAKRHLK